MTTQNNIVDPLALAESSTMKKAFHIKVDNTYLKKFDRIQSYYQSQTDLLDLRKAHIFKMIVDKYYYDLVSNGEIEDDINPLHKKRQALISSNTKESTNEQLDIPQILIDHRKGRL
jgi:hypothetical protein